MTWHSTPGVVFGKFLFLSLVNAIFQRRDDEFTRPTHLLYVDEFQRYISGDFERILDLGHSYRCACTLATQGLSKLVVDEKSNFVNMLLNTARNKIVFGGLTGADAETLSKDLGSVHSVSGVEALYREGVELLVTVDNGIAAHAAVERAKQLRQSYCNYSGKISSKELHRCSGIEQQ